MKISEQGFTERLPGQSTQTGAVTSTTSGSASTQASRYVSSDTLQLSDLASRLQNTSGSDTSRASRISQLTQAVRSNTFQIDPAQISSSMVSESMQSLGR